MTLRGLVWVLVAVVAVGGCSGSEPSPSAPASAKESEIDLPKGVKLTRSGMSVKVGRSATFVVAAGDSASAVTATIKSVKRGKIRDLRYFTLDAASKKTRPFYVTASVENRGPAGLGGIMPPFVAISSKNATVPPTMLNGDFRPCRPRELPSTLLPGKSARLCMVFLLDRGTKITAIKALNDGAGKPVRWKLSRAR